MGKSNEFYGSFMIMIIILCLIVFCIKCCQGLLSNESVPAYSAPIVVTSQTHQQPGSSQAITIINENSSPSGFVPRSSSPAAGMPVPYPKPGFTIPGSQVDSNAPYGPINAGSLYPQQSPYNPQSQQMPHSSPYPPQTTYPPQNVPGVSHGSITPQPSAPYPTSPSLQDMDLPPNYDDAMTNFSKEQKKF